MATMTPQLAWDKFDYWFNKEGHWMFGTGDNGKAKALKAWQTNGIEGLPNYPGDRPMVT